MAARKQTRRLQDGITSDQRQRMEANRIKALEKLAKKRCESSSTPVSKPTPVSFTRRTSNLTKDKGAMLPTTIKAVFDLISPSRFRVTSPSSQHLIDIYKRIASKSYGLFSVALDHW